MDVNKGVISQCDAWNNTSIQQMLAFVLIQLEKFQVLIL